MGVFQWLKNLFEHKSGDSLNVFGIQKKSFDKNEKKKNVSFDGQSLGNRDNICYSRLDEIREELDSYLNFRMIKERPMYSTSVKREISKEKNESKQEKPCSYMKRNDGFSNFDERIALPQQRTELEQPPFLQASRRESVEKQSSSTGIPSDNIKIPEFSRHTEKYNDLDKALEKKEESFSEMLLRMIDEKGLKDSEVYKNANIDRRLFSKIRGDEDYVPSKKTAISFCLALQLKMDETKKLLGTAGYTLSASSKFDLIIMYLIEKCEYNIHFANIVLDDYGVGTLSR